LKSEPGKFIIVDLEIGRQIPVSVFLEAEVFGTFHFSVMAINQRKIGFSNRRS
jgi:hypothetical protein